MDAILSTHNFGVACDPHSYPTPYAVCTWSDNIFVDMESLKLHGFCWNVRTTAQNLFARPTGLRGLCIPVQYSFNKSPLLVSIRSQFNSDELCGFQGRNIFPCVKKRHTARIWGSHSGIAKDSRHQEMLNRKYKALWYSETLVVIISLRGVTSQKNVLTHTVETSMLIIHFTPTHPIIYN